MSGHETHRGAISIPYVTETGVVSIRFRRVDGDGPKYLSDVGDSPRLFNVCDLNRPVDHIVIVEGEFDAMVTSFLCGQPAVGVPGVETWQSRKPWPLLFQGYQRVTVVGDNDEPGKKFANTVCRSLPASVHAVPVTPEGAKDVNELWHLGGVQAVLNMIGERV